MSHHSARRLHSLGHGVRGEGECGVYGESSSTGYAAVAGKHTNQEGYGLVGDTSGYYPSAGVLGRNSLGHGVRGEGECGVYGESSSTGYAAVAGKHTGQEGYGLVGDTSGYYPSAGVLGRNSLGHGVRGEGECGVYGESSSTGYAAVAGKHTGQKGYGLVGDASGDYPSAGVLGRNSLGHGVRGEGECGVYGESSKTGYGAVAGKHTGQEGYGVVGDAAGQDTAGVLGRNGLGHGVRGEGTPGVAGVCTADGGAETGEPSGYLAGVRGKSTPGPGVFGEGHYGGQFKGTGTQLHLVPGTSAGRPTVGFHKIGEIYMDSVATLFVCVANGNPGCGGDTPRPFPPPRRQAP